MEHHNQNSVSVKKQGSKKQGHFYSKREEARPERIHNPITEMGFPTMFTFQLDKTKRKTLPAPYCRNGSCRARLLLLFLNNNDPVFCTLLFAPHILCPFFSGSRTDPWFQNKSSGCRLTERLKQKTVCCEVQLHYCNLHYANFGLFISLVPFHFCQKNSH